MDVHAPMTRAHALALVALAGLFGCSSPRPSSAPLSPQVPGTSTPSTQAESSPTPVPVGVELGSIVDGVPTTVDGEQVFRGDALTFKVAAAGDATPFLAGGWFQAVSDVRFCALFHFDVAVDSCYRFGLYDNRVGGMPRWIGRGDGLVPTDLPAQAVRPVVLAVHTHDPRCPSEAFPDCVHEPVLTSVVWLGETPTDSPPPRVIGTPPPGGLSQAQAIAAAAAQANAHSTPLEVVSARAAPFWAILPDEEESQGGRWVWAIIFESSFSESCGDACVSSSGSALLVLDYVTGELIEAQLPAPSTEP